MKDSEAKILIIEDDSALRQAIVDKLKREGFQVVDAQNGKIGLEKAINEKPDLILLDIIMPVMHGMDVLEELRQDDWGKQAKIILMTNLAEDNKMAKAMDLGVKDYLIKGDWKLNDVIDKVREVLNR